MKVQACTKRIHERGVQWIYCWGCRISDGVVKARDETPIPEIQPEAMARFRALQATGVAAAHYRPL